MAAPRVGSRLEPATRQKRGLTVGDGIAILVLVGFIIFWVCGDIWILRNGNWSSMDEGDFTYSVNLFLTVVFVGPPVWAGYIVTQIVRRY